MTTRTEFPLASGGVVVVDTPDATGVAPAGLGLDRASATLRNSLGPVIRAASDMMDAFHALPRRPSEIEVEFGVTLDAKFGAVITSGSAAVHLNVTLHWTPDPETD